MPRRIAGHERPNYCLRQSKPGAPVRFDAKFIEDHKLIERYLENKLPLKGARDLENWCREHPEYLERPQIWRSARRRVSSCWRQAASRRICASRSRRGGRLPMH